MKITYGIFATLVFIFCSCSPQAGIRLNADNSASIAFKMDGGKNIQSLLQNLGMAQSGAALFNTAQIKSELTAAGLIVTAIESPTPTSLELIAACADLQKLLPSQSEFISVTKTAAQNRLRLRLSPQTIRQITALLPAETADFLDFLIAPVLTAEPIPPAEYTELMGVSYGATAATELKNARFQFSITAPSAIKTVTLSNPDAASARHSGNTAVFTLNLVSFLTDLRTTDYEITW